MEYKEKQKEKQKTKSKNENKKKIDEKELNKNIKYFEDKSKNDWKNNKIYFLTFDANFFSLDLKKTLECGQCFRWERIEEKAEIKDKYIGVIFGRVVELEFEKDKNMKDKIHVYISVTDDEIKDKESFKNNKYSKIKNDLIDYLDLKRNYNFANEVILENSPKKSLKEIKEAIDYGKGIKILNQEVFETILTFIISANNNIPRIKKIINSICINYGKEIKYENEIYYSFPKVEDLLDVSIEEYRKLGAGFRDKRLYETVHKIHENGIEKYIKDKESLKELSGVGDKVAECIMLFSLGKINTFPIDVWVRRVVNDIFFKYEDETKVKRKDIEDFGTKYFGGYSGLTQQYLFYWRRDKK